MFVDRDANQSHPLPTRVPTATACDAFTTTGWIYMRIIASNNYRPYRLSKEKRETGRNGAYWP